jgi:AcrR family transcriptional regulator
MGRPPKGTRPTSDPSLSPEFWRELMGNADPSQREKFLWLAIDLVRKTGLGQFKVTRIAKRLGYSEAMVNHHFGSRDGLLSECAETVHSDYSAKLVGATESAPPDPRSRLEAHIRARLTEGQKLGGWSQVLNYPYHSFESPIIAMARVGASFNESFYRNLLYITQLVVDYREGIVNHTSIDPSEFPAAILKRDADALAHAITIGMATAGGVMWLAGRVETGKHSPEILAFVEMMNSRQTELLIDIITPRS